jgi:hypothetical protein
MYMQQLGHAPSPLPPSPCSVGPAATATATASDPFLFLEGPDKLWQKGKTGRDERWCMKHQERDGLSMMDDP